MYIWAVIRDRCGQLIPAEICVTGNHIYGNIPVIEILIILMNMFYISQIDGRSADYFKWAKEMDIVSWDNYPRYDTPWSETAMCHDLMRGLKDAPFMLMEQTPSQQNWQAYNSLKR